MYIYTNLIVILIMECELHKLKIRFLMLSKSIDKPKHQVSGWNFFCILMAKLGV